MRAEEGMTLIELLIAMVVMSIGIAALVAGFSSGIVSVDRARAASTAGTLADKQMELYRQAAFTSLPMGLQTPTTPTGADGRTYWMQVDGAWTCAVGTYSAGPPAELLRHPRKPSGQARDDQGARRLADREAPLHRERDLRLLDRLTTHST